MAYGPFLSHFPLVFILLSPPPAISVVSHSRPELGLWSPRALAWICFLVKVFLSGLRLDPPCDFSVGLFGAGVVSSLGFGRGLFGCHLDS